MKFRGTVYLNLDIVLRIHQIQLAAWGGAEGIRDRNGLESALAMPMQEFDGEEVHPHLFAKASAYAFHITKAHAFVDGNKRTALGAALLFLDLNGYGTPDPNEDLYQLMMDLTEGKIEKAEFSSALRTIVIDSMISS